MLVKVCGMRDPQNIEDLLRLNIDYMGLIFYEKSPRKVVKSIDLDCLNSIKKVGVFVNRKVEEVLQKVEEFKLDAVQLHGNESPSQCADIQVEDVEVIKAFSVDDSFDFAALDAYQESCNLLLFDAKGENYGGNGIRFNWELLKQYQGKLPFLLSGGIRLQDIKEIMVIQHSKFLGIDVNSGFEISPGVKDINEIEKMLKKVKSHEQVSS